MDLTYITLFRNLLHWSENIAKNPLQAEDREITLTIIDKVVEDIINLLTICKKQKFTLSQDEQCKSCYSKAKKIYYQEKIKIRIN